MKPILSVLLLILSLIYLSAQSTFDQKKTFQTVKTFLSKLDATQSSIVSLDYTDSSRKQWSNLPMEEVNRKGLMVKDMNDEQRVALHDILRTVLSPQGYQKAIFIMLYDEKTHDRLQKLFLPIASRYGKQNYWFSVYGNPDKDNNWAFKFEGHHLSLNFTFAPNIVTCTPMFTGINPAISRNAEDAGVHIMYDEQEFGNQLFNDLSDSQKAKAILGSHPTDADVNTKTGREAHLADKSGLIFSDMTPIQQSLVVKIIRSWVENLKPVLASENMAKILSLKSKIIFKWFGSNDVSKLHYYALQSDSFIIEFTHRDGSIDHYHTLWYELEY